MSGAKRMPVPRTIGGHVTGRRLFASVTPTSDPTVFNGHFDIVCVGEYVGFEEIDDGIWSIYFEP